MRVTYDTRSSTRMRAMLIGPEFRMEKGCPSHVQRRDSERDLRRTLCKILMQKPKDAVVSYSPLLYPKVHFHLLPLSVPSSRKLHLRRLATKRAVSNPSDDKSTSRGCEQTAAVISTSLLHEAFRTFRPYPNPFDDRTSATPELFCCGRSTSSKRHRCSWPAAIATTPLSSTCWTWGVETTRRYGSNARMTRSHSTPPWATIPTWAETRSDASGRRTGTLASQKTTRRLPRRQIMAQQKCE